MSIYEASLKTTDPLTGSTSFHRLFTMPARGAAQVQARAEALSMTKPDAELLVYRF